ncbi:MAG: alkaline shock response membrane anchor protein AmaP [Opitutaceae bacterium]
MDFAEITEALQHLTQPAYLYIGGGVVVCAFLLILLVRRQPKKVVAYVTENGRVMVSRSAIIELVQTSCQQLNDVSKPHVSIQVKGKVTHLDVSIKLLSGGRLRSVEETLQTHLRHALTENLGIENLGRINIVATGFKSGRIEQSSTVNRPADPTQDSFDDDDDFETSEDSAESKSL